MKRLAALPIILLIFVSATTAQTQGNFTQGELERLGQSLGKGYYITSQSTDVTGTPYLNADWVRGVVQIDDNLKTDPMLLRFNTERNILEFARGDKLFGIDSRKIDGFTLFAQPRNLVFSNGFRAEEYDIDPSTLLRVIYDGKVKLVAHHTTSLIEDIPVYGSATKKAEYEDDTDFYLIQPSGQFSEIDMEKDDILDNLEDKKEKLETYADNEDLDFEKEADLIKILKYYDTLKSGGSL